MKVIATIRWHHDGWRSTNQTSDKYLPASVVRWVTLLFWRRLPVLIILFICCFSPLIICRLFSCNRSHSPAGVPLKTRFIKSDHLSLFQCCLCCGSDLAPVWQKGKKKNNILLRFEKWRWCVKTHKQRLVAAGKWKTSSSVRGQFVFSVVFTLLLVVSQTAESRLFIASRWNFDTAVVQMSEVHAGHFGSLPRGVRARFKERFWTLATL